MTETKIKRGFATMDPEKIRELASRGGKASHECGKAYKFTSETGRIAGVKGGKVIAERRRALREKPETEQPIPRVFGGG
jgi:uncharacterized protein